MTRHLVFVIDGLGTGGAERSLAEILDAVLARDDHRATVVYLHQRRGVGDTLDHPRLELVRLQSPRLVGRVAELRRLLRTDRPDLVHSTLFDANLVTRLATAGSGIPVLTSLVNIPYDARRRAGRSPVGRAKLRAVQTVDTAGARLLSHHFHAITYAVRDAAVATQGVRAERITVIERGRDPERLGRPSPERRDRSRRELGLGDGPVLVTLGREEVQKGHVHLPPMMSRLGGSHPDAVLLVGGRPGAASAEISAAVQRHGVSERYLRLGFRPDAPELLAAADVFVFPSLWEGLGGALIEAMALGLPIVASRLPAVAEVVDEGGNALLIEPGDSGAMAEAVASLLADPERRARFGDHSRRRYEALYTSEQINRRMLDLYDAMIAGTAEAIPATTP